MVRDKHMKITDCHIHIQPYEMFKAGSIEVMKKARGHFEDILEYCRSPKALLKYLDSVGVERAVLINYVAPEVMGLTAGAAWRDPRPSGAAIP